MRQYKPGAVKIVPPLAAAALIDKTISAGRRQLASCIKLGERAQALRNADALLRAGQGILNLSLGAEISAIGSFYIALSLNRARPSAYQEANRILIDVADHGPAVFRAKALVAVGANSQVNGDLATAASVQADALRIATDCGPGGVHSVCCIQIQTARTRSVDGDYKSALGILESLSPYIHSLGHEYLALVHFYYNNLAVLLAKNGRTEQARSLSKILLASPFLESYPEWQETCADLATRVQPTPPLVFHLGAPSADPAPSSSFQSNVLMLPANKDAAVSPAAPPSTAYPVRRAKVLHLNAWKKKNQPKLVNPPPRLKIFREQIPLLTTQQKQAAILRLILSDDITDLQLNRVLESVIDESPGPAV
jgi:tetratricopeptide (TPR) repeat protein